MVGTIAVKQRPRAAKPQPATKVIGHSTGSHRRSSASSPAHWITTSTADTMTTYMVASRPAHSTSPHTTWVSSTWVVSWPSHVRW